MPNAVLPHGILAIEQFFNEVLYEKKAITRIAFFSLMIIFLNQVS